MSEHKYPKLELPSATLHGRGNSSGQYFKIEVRTESCNHVVLPGDIFPFVIDNYWRALPITNEAQKWGVNIPIRRWDSEACAHGLLPYVAAEAHRWAFLAALEATTTGGTLCIETRLVEVVFIQTYEIKEIGVSSPASTSASKKATKFGPRAIAAQENAS